MSLMSIINSHRSKHYCYLENDPNATDPPEYFIPGATSIPVVRDKTVPFRNIQPIDERRESIKHIEIKDNSDSFLLFLFSNKIFSIDIYDYDYIISLIDEGINRLNYIGLIVHLTFSLEENGTYLLKSKNFLNSDFKPYYFENNISSVFSIHYNDKNPHSTFFQKIFDGVSIRNYMTKETHKKSIYLFDERIYLDVIVNSELKDVLTPLIIAYDEFGILYTEYYYNSTIISTDILKSLDPFFDEKIADFYYLTPEEVDTLEMLLV
jgi:hypothetical protein